MASTLFSWLHLSDLHANHGSAEHWQNQQRILSALVQDIPRAIERGAPRPEVVLVTGDIAFSGNVVKRPGEAESREYARAGEWLTEVAAAIQVGPGSIFMVPGNHDVARSTKGVPRSVVRDLRRGDLTVDDALSDDEHLGILRARLAGYLGFCDELNPICAVPGSWAHSVERGRLLVRLVGLNTALLCNDDADQGQLRLGQAQLGPLLEPARKENEVIVALSHHPLQGGWLADEEGAASWVRNRAQVHLSGHVHQARSLQSRYGGAGAVHVAIVAGAVHEDAKPREVPAAHGYNIGALLCAADGSVKLRVWPRRWSPSKAHFASDSEGTDEPHPYAEHEIGLRLPAAADEASTPRPAPGAMDSGAEARAVSAPQTRAGDAGAPATGAAARALSEQLDAARTRQERLKQVGFSTTAVDREILALRRERRAGDQLHAGDSLGGGRYLLLEQVGRGGFGLVWRARDWMLEREVAIKVLHNMLASDSVRRERFFRGARVMSELEHEAVVRVLERRGQEGDFSYFVMELVPGGDLRQAVLGGRLQGEPAIPLIVGAGEALAAAHQRGIIHRDVKPANILLDASGAPRLTDFDLVAVADTTGGTRTGALGTWIYAAPESMDRPQDADARADVYGLGMTAAFAIHGADLPMDVVRNAGRFIDGLACTEAVKVALKRAVEWERGARFPDAGALCGALRAAIAPPATPANHRRDPVSMFHAGAADLSLQGLAPEKARPGLDFSNLDLRGQDLTGRDFKGATLDGTDLTDARGGVRSVAFSPDSATLATGGQDGTVRRWEATLGKPLRTTSSAATSRAPSGTPSASAASSPASSTPTSRAPSASPTTRRSIPSRRRPHSHTLPHPPRARARLPRVAAVTHRSTPPILRNHSRPLRGIDLRPGARGRWGSWRAARLGTASRARGSAAASGSPPPRRHCLEVVTPPGMTARLDRRGHYSIFYKKSKESFVEYRQLGGSGLKVPVLSFGTGTFGGSDEFFKAWGSSDVAEATRLVDVCLEAGLNMFDSADIYSGGTSESILGAAIKGRRNDVILSTKATFRRGEGPNDVGSSRFHLIRAVEESLRRLGTDYIDLFQLHGFDAIAPVEETVRTLDDLVRAGKIRYLGASNFSGWHLMKSLAVADRYGWSRYVAHQAYYSLIGREYEWELMPLALDQKVGAVVWSPLGWGRLTGKIRRGQPIPETSRLQNKRVTDAGPSVADELLYRVVDALDEVAKETGKTVPQIALNWLLQRPSVANVIVGARNEEQLKQNLGAVGWNLSAEQVAKLDAASATQKIYPYWHQAAFKERNPFPAG